MYPEKGDEVMVNPNVDWDTELKKFSGKTFIVDEIEFTRWGLCAVSPFKVSRLVKCSYQGYAMFDLRNLIIIKRHPNNAQNMRRIMPIDFIIFIFCLLVLWVEFSCMDGGPFVHIAIFCLNVCVIRKLWKYYHGRLKK